MDLSKLHIRRCFNKAAITYDLHSRIQQQAGQTLISLLENITQQADRIIDLGCGTGLTSEHLARKMHFKQFYAIDIADQLLIKARQRLRYPGMNVYERDFDTLNITDGCYDLIFSNMSLQWSNQIEQTLAVLMRLLSANGLLAFSLPLTGTFNELPALSRNHFLSFEKMCRLLGCNLLLAKTENKRIDFESQYAALTSIKASGANYVSGRDQTLHSGLSTEFRPVTSTFTLTYHIGYFIAGKTSHG